MEIPILSTGTVIDSFPLLLFAGISVAIIFMLLHREFSLEDMRLKVSWFIIIPLYLGLINILLFLYANSIVRFDFADTQCQPQSLSYNGRRFRLGTKPIHLLQS